MREGFLLVEWKRQPFMSSTGGISVILYCMRIARGKNWGLGRGDLGAWAIPVSAQRLFLALYTRGTI